MTGAITLLEHARKICNLQCYRCPFRDDKKTCDFARSIKTEPYKLVTKIENAYREVNNE